MISIIPVRGLPAIQALGLYREEAYGDNGGRQPLAH